jgi:hypothetical protein
MISPEFCRGTGLSDPMDGAAGAVTLTQNESLGFALGFDCLGRGLFNFVGHFAKTVLEFDDSAGKALADFWQAFAEKKKTDGTDDDQFERAGHSECEWEHGVD